MKVSLVTSAILTLSLMGAAFGQCEDMSGDWYDAATEDVMRVSVIGCQMTSKYGTASVIDSRLVTPTDGILQTLKITGDYDNRMGTIKWSNGIRWIRSLTSELRERIEMLEKQKIETEQRLDGVDALIAKLFNCTKCDTSGSIMPQQPQEPTIDIQELANQIQVLNETISDVNRMCSNYSTQSIPTNSTDVMYIIDQIKELNRTISDVNSSKCSSCSSQSISANVTNVMQLVDQIKELNETIMDVNSSKCVTCSMSTNSTDVMQLADRIQELNKTIVDVNNTKQCSSCGSTSTELKEITNSVEILNRTISDMNSTTGRDGYCTIEPNVTDVYVPVTRYVHRVGGNLVNKCTVGGPAWRGGSANKDAASMMTRSEIDDPNCRWGAQMTREPMLAYKGDTIVFWRNGGIFTTLYEFEDEKVCLCEVFSHPLSYEFTQLLPS